MNHLLLCLKFQALEGLKFQALEGLKSNAKADDSNFGPSYFDRAEGSRMCYKKQVYKQVWIKYEKRSLPI